MVKGSLPPSKNRILKKQKYYEVFKINESKDYCKLIKVKDESQSKRQLFEKSTTTYDSRLSSFGITFQEEKKSEANPKNQLSSPEQKENGQNSLDLDYF